MFLHKAKQWGNDVDKLDKLQRMGVKLRISSEDIFNHQLMYLDQLISKTINQIEAQIMDFNLTNTGLKYKENQKDLKKTNTIEKNKKKQKVQKTGSRYMKSRSVAIDESSDEGDSKGKIFITNMIVELDRSFKSEWISETEPSLALNEDLNLKFKLKPTTAIKKNIDSLNEKFNKERRLEMLYKLQGIPDVN